MFVALHQLLHIKRDSLIILLCIKILFVPLTQDPFDFYW